MLQTLQTTATIDAVFVWGVFVAGILSFFSPCVFPLLPVYAGVLVEDTGNRHLSLGKFKIYLKPALKTLCFIAGISIVFIALSVGASSLGVLFHHPAVTIIMGIFVIIMGLHQTGIITIPQLYKQKTLSFDKDGKAGERGYLGAFLLGLGFSFGWTPCIGPVLSTVLVIAAGSGQAFFGVSLMALYSLGLAIPFILVSLAATPIMKHFAKLKKHMITLKRIGGILIIMMGVLLILGRFNILANIFQ